MAIPLVVWDSISPLRPPLSLSESALSEAFSSLSEVFPVLYIGLSQSKQAGLILNIELPSQPGVFLYPKPVQTGGNSLLLIRANLNFQDSQSSEIQRKVLFSLLAISAVVCVEDSEGSIVLQQVQEMCKIVEKRMGLNERKLVRIARENCIESPENPLLEEMCCLLHLHAFLSEKQLHTQFESSMSLIKTATHCQSPFQALMNLLTSLLSLASFPLSLLQFLIHTNAWKSPDFPTTLAHLQKDSDRITLLTSASVQQLILADADAVLLNSSAMHELCERYQLASPVVVLTVLGLPQLGICGLVNSIVRSSCGYDIPDMYLQAERPTALLQPLELGPWQLLLVDGSGVCCGSPTAAQDSMLSAVLMLTSVPCLVIDESEDSLRLVTRVIEKVTYWNQAFGFSTERIHLLVSQLDGNKWAEETAACLNRQYFGGSEVISVVYAPSFAVNEPLQYLDASFTANLLSASQFPKRNYSGSASVLSNLLDSLRFLLSIGAESPSRLEPANEPQANRILSAVHEELQALYRAAQPDNEHSHLDILFNEMFRRGISVFLMNSPADSLQGYILTRITAVVNQYRLQLAQIENCHRYTAHMTADKVANLVEKVLDYLYKEAWVVNKFMERAKELKRKLVGMMGRYADDRDKLEDVLVKFSKKKKNLRNWFIANYAATAASTLASGGLKLAARGVSAAFTASTVGNALAGSRTDAFEVKSYGIGLTPLICGKAIDLVKKAGGTLAKARSFFSKSKDHLLSTSDFQAALADLDISAPMVVLLVLGNKSSGANKVLNEVVQCMCPFTSSCAEAFQGGKSSQCLFFSHYQHGLLRTGSEPCQGLIIYLQTTDKPGSRKDRMIAACAGALLQRVSTVYIFINNESQYVSRVVDVLQGRRLPKITAVLLGTAREYRGDMRRRLQSYRGAYELRVVDGLGEDEVKSVAVGMKCDMERAEVIEKRDFEKDIAAAIEAANAVD